MNGAGRPAMPDEATADANLMQLRYAQCWEDADVLLEGLHIQPGDNCLSIASAGDNALAMLSHSPGRLVAIDLSAAQLACLELRVAAFRTLSHAEMLLLIGSSGSCAESGSKRVDPYRRCAPLLSGEARGFWDARPRVVAAGLGWLTLATVFQWRDFVYAYDAAFGAQMAMIGLARLRHH